MAPNTSGTQKRLGDKDENEVIWHCLEQAASVEMSNQLSESSFAFDQSWEMLNTLSIVHADILPFGFDNNPAHITIKLHVISRSFKTTVRRSFLQLGELSIW